MDPYERIGAGYALRRRADPRVAARIADALGPAESVVNVGAGAGSYEPRDRAVVAVEPAWTMIRQRVPGSAPVVRATAMALPFRDSTFAAALAVLTIHHWPDPARGLAEIARVARDRVVVLTWDPDFSGFWLVDDYFPEIARLDRGSAPGLDELAGALTDCSVLPMPVPHDCSDGFLGAYWRRPEAYLDPDVRAAISVFHAIEGVEDGLARLARDLEDGTWHRRNQGLLDLAELNLGYRLVVGSPR